MRQLVYFIQAGESGPIKIGVSLDPASRLVALQTGHQHDLVLLGVTPGGRAREKELHGALSGSRIDREWFRPSKEVIDAISANAQPLSLFTAVHKEESPPTTWPQKSEETERRELVTMKIIMGRYAMSKLTSSEREHVLAEMLTTPVEPSVAARFPYKDVGC